MGGKGRRLRQLYLLALSLWISGIGPGEAKDNLGVRLPSLERILPLGGRAGTEVSVSLLGDMLSNTEAVEFDCADLSFKLGKANAGGIDGTIRISPGAALGPHMLRARTKDGRTNALMFTVGQFTPVAEQEPNESKDQAQKVAPPCEIYGSMGKEDRDYFSVQAEAGERWLFEIRAAQYGSTFESQLYLRDENGRELAFNDDRGDFDVNSMIDFTFRKKGKYFVHVDAFRNVRSWEFTKNCGYVLRISKLPRLSYIAPLGARAGSTVKLHIAGVALQETRRVFLSPTRRGEYSTLSIPWTLPVRFVEDFSSVAEAPRVEAKVLTAGPESAEVEFTAPAEPLGTWSVFVEGKDGITDPMLFEVGREDELAEVEPNDARDAPQPIALEGEKPLVINGALQRRKVTELIQDVDFYALKAKKGVPLHLYTVAYQLRAPEIDTVLRVLDSKGKVLAESDDLTAGRGFLMGSADSSLFYVPEQDEEIFVTVLDRVGRGGPSYQYRLHIKVEEPGFHLIVAPQSGLRSVPISNFTVPRGGEANLLVSLFRLPPQSYSDDPLAASLAPPPGAVMKGVVRVWVEGLPPGVTAVENKFRADEITEPGGDGVTMAIPERLVTINMPASVPAGTYPFRVMGEVIGNEKVRAAGVAMDSMGGLMGSWNYFNLPGAETMLTVIDPGGMTLELEKDKVSIAQGGSTEIIITNWRKKDDDPLPKIRMVHVPEGLRHEVSIGEKGNLLVTLRAGEDLPIKPIEDVYIEIELGNRIVSTRPFNITVFAKEKEGLTAGQF